MSNHNILEQTQIIDSNMSHQVHFYGPLLQYNAQLERFVHDIDERRGRRLRESNRLPPLISYSRRERRLSYGGGGECVICLEDFEDGEPCQVLPACNHIFHTNCIDHWLKNRFTCPVCRNCLLDRCLNV